MVAGAQLVARRPFAALPARQEFSGGVDGFLYQTNRALPFSQAVYGRSLRKADNRKTSTVALLPPLKRPAGFLRPQSGRGGVAGMLTSASFHDKAGRKARGWQLRHKTRNQTLLTASSSPLSVQRQTRGSGGRPGSTGSVDPPTSVRTRGN